MVTWSVTSTSVPPSEYFCSGTSPSEDAAIFAALSCVGSLAVYVPAETPYCVTIGTEVSTVTAEEALNTVVAGFSIFLPMLDTVEALRQFCAAAEL